MRMSRNCNASLQFLLVLSCILSTFLVHGQTTTAPPLSSSASSSLAVTASSTAAPTSPVTTTPAPSTLAPVISDTRSAMADLIFNEFAQGEATDFRQLIASKLNTSIGRVTFETRGGRIGYLFGDDFIIRVIVQQPTKADPRAAYEVRDALLSMAGTDTDLINIGVLRGIAVPNNPTVFVFKIRTTWDILWTLLIVAGGIGFWGFIGFVVYKCYRARKFEAAEKKLEAQESEERLKQQKLAGAQQHAAKGGQGINNSKDKKEGQQEEMELEMKAVQLQEDAGDEEDHVDGMVMEIASKYSQEKRYAMLASQERALAEASQKGVTKDHLNNFVLPPADQDVNPDELDRTRRVYKNEVQKELSTGGGVLQVPQQPMLYNRVVPTHLAPSSSEVGSRNQREKVLRTLADCQLPPPSEPSQQSQLASIIQGSKDATPTGPPAALHFPNFPSASARGMKMKVVDDSDL